MAQGQNQQGRRGGGGDQRAAEERQIAGAINSLHRDYNTTQQNRKQEDREHLKWNRRIAIAAIGYTIFTACLLVLTIYSIQQTWTAIGAATRQADTSEDTEKRQLRAYVGVTPGEVTKFGTRDQTFSFSRKNVGQTPAYDVGFVGVGFDIRFVPSQVPNSPGCKSPAIRDLFTLFPNNPAPWDISGWDEKKFTQNMIDTVKANENRISGHMFMIWGTICYDDAFKKAHYTNFCYMYHGSNIGKPPFDVCLGHNDSD